MGENAEQDEAQPLGEFDIIARYFAPLATSPAALSLLDDAALLPLPEGQELVAACDTVAEGVHFLASDPPETIGHKALAVSLSDLAAKGARPVAYLLMLSVPEQPTPDWLASFTSGIQKLQQDADVTLIGGDTTRAAGALTISTTALGFAPQGEAVLRSGAMAGDRLYVSGTIGDAALGLKLMRGPQLASTWGLSEPERTFLVDRYRRPRPRCALALPLRHYARAAIDISDGLAGDVDKLCKASSAAGIIEAAHVPLSAAAAKAVACDPGLLADLIGAGDDYEVVAAVSQKNAGSFEAEAKSHGVSVTAIGAVEAGEPGVRILDGERHVLRLEQKGFAHF